jgi:O-antigen ligase
MIGALILYFLNRDNKLSFFKETSVKWYTSLQVLAIFLLPISVWKSNSINFLINDNLRSITTFMLLLIAINSKSRFNLIAKTILFSLVFVACRIIWAYKQGSFIFVEGTARVVGIGTLGSSDPNDVALALVMMCPIALAYVYIEKGAKKIVYFGVLALLIAAILYTGSRGGFLGFIGMAIPFLALVYKKQKIKFIAIITLLALSIVLFLPNQYKQRFLSIFDKQGYSYSNEKHGRIALWKRGLDSIKEQPLGIGIRNSSIGEGIQKQQEGVAGAWRVLHNAYLQIGVELGVLGLFVYLMFLFSGFVNIRKIRAVAEKTGDRVADVYACALGAGLAGFMVSSFFLSQAYYWNHYIFVALTVALKRLVVDKKLVFNHEEQKKELSMDIRKEKNKSLWQIR